MLMDIRDALAAAGEASTVPEIGRDYVAWVAFATFVVVALLALGSTIGRDSDTKWLTRTLAVGSAAAACLIHYAGVWQLFYFNPDASAVGTVVMYAAYALMLIGAFLGPRSPRPSLPYQPTTPTTWEPPSWQPRSAPPPPPWPAPGRDHWRRG